jgi:hypothetical protein
MNQTKTVRKAAAEAAAAGEGLESEGGGGEDGAERARRGRFGFMLWS